MCINQNNISSDGIINERNHKYPEFLKSIKTNFMNCVTSNDCNTPLFLVTTSNLFDVFLNNIPVEHRQHYNCNTCRHFVNNFGGLVTITPKGETVSVIWDVDNTPEFFVQAVRELNKVVLRSKVRDVFISSEYVLGQSITGEWEHMSIDMPVSMVYHARLKTSYQMMCEKAEDRKMLIHAILNYSSPAIKQAVTLLNSEALYHSKMCCIIAEWFLDIHIKYNDVKNSKIKDNLVWRAVATAPIGFCHVRSSMIGTVLDDIVNGLNFETIKIKFNKKMDPTQYQRPQARPSYGNIQQGEKIIDKLGLKNSLHRRFARLDELQTIWMPKEARLTSNESSGVFSHLIKNDKSTEYHIQIPPNTMSWRKFYETIIPFALKMEWKIENNRKYNIFAILTANDSDAPPIIQWDSVEHRNPFFHVMHIITVLFVKIGIFQNLDTKKLQGFVYIQVYGTEQKDLNIMGVEHSLLLRMQKITDMIFQGMDYSLKY